MFNNGYDSNCNDKTKSKPSISHTPPEKTTANSFRKLLKNFASDTSFGGVSKATLSEGHLRRLMWCLISMTCYGFTIYMCYGLIVTYLRKPISTSVDIVYEKNIDFPAVTVCNLNQFRDSKIRNISEVQEALKSFSNEKRNKSDGSNFEKTFSNHKNVLQKDASRDIGGDGVTGAELDGKVVIHEMVAILASYYKQEDLVYVGHQEEDMIKSCSWRGFNCMTGPLVKYWRSSWNWKYGNCFTFNPGANQSGYPLVVFRTSKPGPNFGLSLDINIEQMEYVKELSDEAGIKIVIHNAREMPFPYDEGITVPPGFSSSIAIRKESITRVDPFKNGSCNPALHVAVDNIYKNYNSGFPVKYSVKACLQSCLANEQQRACNCTQAKFAHLVEKICEEEHELQCIANVTELFKKSHLGCDARCPQPCQQDSYRYSIMTSSLTSSAKEEKKKQDFGGKPNIVFDDNFLRVKVFYEELNLQKIVQSTPYDLENLLGDIGGQLGLWIGISVISVAEFGELLISLCLVAARKSRDRKKTASSEMELK